jgi:hypothetical protein
MKEWFEELGLDQATPGTEGGSLETSKGGEGSNSGDTSNPTENSSKEERQAAGELTNDENEDVGDLDAAREVQEDDDFWKMVNEQEGKNKKPRGGRGKNGRDGKKDNCSCSAPTGKTVTPATPPTPKEPPKDIPLLVVLTNYNEQKDYPAGTTLDEVRQDLEMDYPAYSEKNTTWYFEEQREKNRVLCIPSVKSNKAG